MPVAIPIIAGALAGAGAAALGATFATAVVVGSVVAVGTSLLTQPSIAGVPQPQIPTSYRVDPTSLSFQGDAPKRLIYGRPRVSGVVAYANVAGKDHRDLYMVVLLAAHQVAEVEAVYLDGKPESEFAGYLEWWWHDGSANQQADQKLMGVFPEWTANHRLRGIAYAVVKLIYDREVYISGAPRNIQFDVKGKPVWDPRTNKVAWSSNPALILMDYLRSEHGLSAPLDEFDLPHVIASAEICDEKPTQFAASLCSGRYTCDGVIELSQSKSRVMEMIVSSMAGALVWSESKFYIYAGAPQEPVGTIDESQVAGSLDIVPTSALDQTFNTIKGTFLDASNGWVFNDFPPVSADEYVDVDGERLIRDIQLPLTASGVTAQRISTIFLRRERLGETVTIECDWSVFNYAVWDVVELNFPTLGWSDRQFQITSWAFRMPTEKNAGGITLTLREYHPEIYSDDINIAPEYGAGEIIVPDVTLIEPPGDLLAVSDITTVDLSTMTPRVKSTWSQSYNPYCIGYEIAVHKQGEEPESWELIQSPYITWHYHHIEAETPYIVHLRALNSFGKRSAVATYGPITSKEGDVIPISPPRGITAHSTGRWVTISWGSVEGAVSYSVYVRSGADLSFVEEVKSPATTVTTEHLVFPSEYVIYAHSSFGGVSEPGVISVDARQDGSILARLRDWRDADEIFGFVIYKGKSLVPQSTKLASEQGWETFDTAVPSPVEESGIKSRFMYFEGRLMPGGAIYARYPVEINTKPSLMPEGYSAETGSFTDSTEVEGMVQVGIEYNPAARPLIIDGLDVYLEEN